MQRARGVASHFNVSSVADEVAFTALGGGSIVVLVAVLVAVLVISWRRRMPPPLASAVRSGLAVLLVSQAVGGLMIQRGIASLDSAGPASHAISPSGDLKVSHAVAMHAIQVLPVLALWLMAAGKPPGAARTTVRVVALGYAGVVAATLVQAVSGRAVSDPGAVPLVLAVVGAVVVAGGLAVGARAPAGPATTPR